MGIPPEVHTVLSFELRVTTSKMLSARFEMFIWQSCKSFTTVCFSVVEYESDKVFVQKELDNLQLLLDINNIRFRHSKVIDYTVGGEVTNQMLPPLSMITIVENAFKYGDLADPDSCMKIKLFPQQIYCYCRNKKKKKNIELSSHNIGITNLSKRLDISFKGKYEIKPTDEHNFYTFELTVNN